MKYETFTSYKQDHVMIRQIGLDLQIIIVCWVNFMGFGFPLDRCDIRTWWVWLGWLQKETPYRL